MTHTLGPTNRGQSLIAGADDFMDIMDIVPDDAFLQQLKATLEQKVREVVSSAASGPGAKPAVLVRIVGAYFAGSSVIKVFGGPDSIPNAEDLFGERFGSIIGSPTDTGFIQFDNADDLRRKQEAALVEFMAYAARITQIATAAGASVLPPVWLADPAC